jgi:flagellar basal-body rod protein FlgB
VGRPDAATLPATGNGLPSLLAAPRRLLGATHLARRLRDTRRGRSRSQRMGLLASNIANAATPGFKARDLDFGAALSAAEGGAPDLGTAMRYRVPAAPSLDGNTVELNAEQTAFAENAVQYQTTLAFLNGRIAQITRALKGE